MMHTSARVAGCVACMSLVVAADAAIIGATQVRYRATGVDASGEIVRVTVADLYLLSNDATDVALNVYDANISNSAGAGAYYQTMTGPTWDPLRNNVATEAWHALDSFVTIGGIDAASNTVGPMQELVSSSAIDPNFGPLNTPAPEEDAGWFNSNPTNLNGMVGDTVIGLGLFVGRFSLQDAGVFQLEGELSVTWNAGLQTPPHQGSFDIAMGSVIAVPGAGGLAFLAAIPVRRRRRR